MGVKLDLGRAVALAAAVGGLAAALPVAAQAQETSPSLEVRFCPEGQARSYPMESSRNAHSLLLQSAAVVNRGTAEVALEGVTVELLRQGEVQDARRIGQSGVTAAAAQGARMQASGMMEVMGFQYCDGRMLNGAKLSDDAVLSPGEAVMLLWQPFAWRGVRDEVRIRAEGQAQGQAIAGTGAVKIVPALSKTEFRWPLKGGPWYVAAAATVHSHHRWGVPEEFALDLVKVGPDGRTHKGKGQQHRDFYAYDAEVVAAADGVVVETIVGQSEDAPMLRRPDEDMQAYLGRVAEAQNVRLAKGLDAVIGDAVIIDHGQGEYGVYAHLRPGTVSVKPGDKVTAGRVLGRLGSSGNSTEAHLHFQICDRPETLSCAGISPRFTNIDLPIADGPRPLQTGDVVIAR